MGAKLKGRLLPPIVGTFEVKIFDNFEVDIQKFKGKYPGISNCQVANSILPPWEKPGGEKN
jgi:hypothetical protein